MDLASRYNRAQLATWTWQRNRRRIGIRKSSRARAPESPMSGEGMDTRTARPDDEHTADEETLRHLGA